jgi:hypothetical protein
MKYRILATLILIASLVGVAVMFEEGTQSPNVPAPSSSNADDSSMKNLKIN